jgi:hypothetical protein
MSSIARLSFEKLYEIVRYQTIDGLRRGGTRVNLVRCEMAQG